MSQCLSTKTAQVQIKAVGVTIGKIRLSRYFVGE